MKKKCLLLIAMLCLLISAIAQEKLQFGIKLINEITFYNGYAPGGGVQCVYRPWRHIGLETGVNYKIRPLTAFFPTQTGEVVRAEVFERNIIVPILFRYDSKIINLSIGPAVEFFLGWKVKNPDSHISPYQATSPELISTAAISKTFYLSRTVIIEPELRFSAFVPNGDGGWGLNLSIRKSF